MGDFIVLRSAACAVRDDSPLFKTNWLIPKTLAAMLEKVVEIKSALRVGSC